MNYRAIEQQLRTTEDLIFNHMYDALFVNKYADF